MKRRHWIWIAALLATPPLGLIVTPPTKAQDAPAASQQASANQDASQEDEAPLSDKRPRPLGAILQRMSRLSKAAIVADSRTAKLMVAPPADPTTPDNFEAQITALTKALPKATWAKLLLPERRGKWDGDAVAEFAEAQAKLYGRVGERLKPDEVEIMGQHLPKDKAEVHITGLNLVPVYLITTAASENAAVDPGQWASLSPQEKRAYARQQAAQLANSDPAVRNAVAQQYFMIFNQLMMGLSPSDRQNLLTGMSGPGERVNVILRQDGPGKSSDINIGPGQ